MQRRTTFQFVAQARAAIYESGVTNITVDHRWSIYRKCSARLISNNLFEAFIGAMIMANVVILCIETNRRVDCPDPNHDECPANSINLVIPSQIILAVFIVELLLRFYVYQEAFFAHTWNLVDGVVISLSILGEIFSSVMTNFAVIRICRLLRITRLLRILSVFHELYLLMSAMGSTMRTIFWACLTLTVVLSVCSIIAVELLHPVALKLVSEGWGEDCDRCPDAFRSVENAMLTFFQTLIMGDGISDYFIPLMERDGWACLFLLTTVAIVYLGFSNLILSVIVEKADQARNSDTEYQKMMHSQAAEEVKFGLLSVWQKSDADSDGSMTLEELQQQYEGDENFRNQLDSMDLDLPVLEYAFRLVDIQRSGDITFDAFANCVARLKNADTGPMIQFIKAQVSRLVSDVSTLRNELLPPSCGSKTFSCSSLRAGTPSPPKDQGTSSDSLTSLSRLQGEPLTVQARAADVLASSSPGPAVAAAVPHVVSGLAPVSSRPPAEARVMPLISSHASRWARRSARPAPMGVVASATVAGEVLANGRNVLDSDPLRHCEPVQRISPYIPEVQFSRTSALESLTGDRCAGNRVSRGGAVHPQAPVPKLCIDLTKAEDGSAPTARCPAGRTHAASRGVPRMRFGSTPPPESPPATVRLTGGRAEDGGPCLTSMAPPARHCSGRAQDSGIGSPKVPPPRRPVLYVPQAHLDLQAVTVDMPRRVPDGSRNTSVPARPTLSCASDGTAHT